MRTVGPYELLDELGKGGAGHVFRARHTRTGEVLALKVLAPGSGLEDLERFQREIAALGRVAGAGVVPLRDAGETAGVSWYAMTLMPGGSLRGLVDGWGTAEGKARADWRRCVALVAKVARAVERGHEAGLVHRDLKPENVLLDERGEPCVADWGCVRELGAAPLTATGTNPGTWNYMAPEQLAGEKVDARADVFALGVILHELLSGERPFQGRNLLELVKAVRAGAFRPASAVAGSPPGIDAALARALAPDRDDRYETAGGFALALEDELAAAGPGLRGRASAGVLAALGAAGLVLGGVGLAASLGGRASPQALPLAASSPSPRAPSPTRPSPAAAELTPKPDAIEEGRRLLLAHRLEEARSFLTAAIEAGDHREVLYGLRGNARFDQGDAAGAVEDLEHAVSLDPQDSIAWKLLAGASAHLRQDARAFEAAARAVELEKAKGLTGALLYRARIYITRERWPEACADLDRALQEAPGDLEAWELRARVHGHMNALEATVEDATRAIELSQGRSGEGYSIRGKAFALLGNDARALEDLGRAIELDPKDAHSLTNRATVHLRRNENEAALADFVRALELDPSLGPAWLGAGSLHRLLDRPEIGVTELDRAIELMPRDPGAWLQRGLAHAELRHRAEAIRDLERALELEPEGPNAQHARERLEKLRR